jgi:oligopeptide/dipeptide ABC transporter ATP-binding protein
MAGSGKAHLRDNPLLSVQDLVVDYVGSSGVIHAVSKISFDVERGETLGIVGESGCGKSTTGRAILGLEKITSGQVSFDNFRLDSLKASGVRQLRRRMQMIFQDPIGSLNPRRKVRDIVIEGCNKKDSGDLRAAAEKVLAEVGLPAERFSDLLPRSLSGGQAQRVAIARAVAMKPELLVCDEPVSALDVSVQAQIVNLLEDLKQNFGLTIIFIAHDLTVVRSISDRVLVLYLGKVCEIGDPDVVFFQPAHPYTRALLDSIPNPDPDQGFTGSALSGDLPSPMSLPSGCHFRTRCPRVQDLCVEVEPQMAKIGENQFAACHFPLSLDDEFPQNIGAKPVQDNIAVL